MATVAQLKVKLGADTSDVDKGLKDVNSKVKDTGGWFSSAAHTMLGFVGGAAIIGGVSTAFSVLKNNIGDMISAGMEANQVMAQTVAGLKSTHDASGLTAQGIVDLADKTMRLTGINDDSVQSAENMLLTFTNIGKNVFPQATQAVADMATKMNNGAIPSQQQMQQASVLLGKALNDPIKGISALQRVGVTFTDQQKEQIKQMMAAGNVAGAQNIIIGEMTKEFGGAAAAAGNANGGIGILTARLDQMKQTIGQAVIPILNALLGAVMPLADWLSNQLTNAIKSAQDIFNSLHTTLQPFLDVLPTLWGLVQGIGRAFMGVTVPIKTVADAFTATKPPTEAVHKAISKVGGVFKDLKPPAEAVHKVVSKIGGAFGTIKAPSKDFLDITSKITDFLRGAQPVFKEIGDAVRSFGQIFVADVLPAGKQFIQVYLQVVGSVLSQLWAILKAVIPIVLQFAQFFIANVIPAALKLAATFEKNLLPIINKLGDFITGTLLPIIHTVVTVFEKDVWPAIMSIADVIEKQLMPPVSKLITKFIDIAQHVLPILNPLLQFVGWIIGHVVGPAISLIIHIIAGLVTGLFDVIDAIGNVLGFFGRLKDGIGSLLGHLGKLKDFVVKDIQNAFKGLAKGIGDAFGAIWNTIKAPLNMIIGGLNTLIQGIDNLKFNIPSWVPVIGGNTWSINIPQIPKLAEGGNIMKAGSVLVGERGPELLSLPSGASVTPLTGRNSAAQGSQHTIIVELDGRQLTRIVLDNMPELVRLKTGTRLA